MKPTVTYLPPAPTEQDPPAARRRPAAAIRLSRARGTVASFLLRVRTAAIAFLLRARALAARHALHAYVVGAQFTRRVLAAPDGNSLVPDDARGHILAGATTIAFFFGGLGLWAATAPISGAAVAPGVTKVEGNRQTLQHRDGGIVRKIMVKDGDRVQQGQLLIKLDDTGARAKVDSILAVRDALKATEARLIAERDSLPTPEFDPLLTARKSEPAVATAMRNQVALFESRGKEFHTQIDVLRQKIAQLREQIAGAQIQADAAKRQQGLIGEELDGVRQLYDKGYAPKTRILALERSESELASNEGTARASIAKFEQAIGETKLQIVQIEHARLSQITDQLRDTQTKLNEIGPLLQDAQEALQRTSLVAPVAGEVVGLKVFTEGGVIGAGDRVLDVVPLDSPLIVEARVRPQDIDDVAANAEAEIRLTGIVGRKRPYVNGTVQTISADRLEDQRSGDAYYAAQIRIDRASAQQAGVALQAGMSTEVMITTKPRSVLEYLLSPLSDQIARGFRED